ncbi:hypothetical protein LPE509_03104 [Legionella pneumophila subsp. pneumophila LPE509]|nr:hypothetical protein LPE509_03104 [Legionella pneumophila subsp. pneumophila LPE509]
MVVCKPSLLFPLSRIPFDLYPISKIHYDMSIINLSQIE